MNHGTSRRSFLVSASGMVGMGMVGGATAAAAFPSILPASVLGRGGRAGPNDRVGLGLIGCGKRMFEMIGPFLNRPDTRVVAVCDVDTTRREHARSIVDGHYAKSPGSAAAPCVGYNDHREVLARKDVDAVVIGTPDHWHAIQIVDAARAGKDIYCEKPLTLTIAEAKASIDAVRAHKRVFQTGSQQRTEFDGRFRRACELVRSGRLGRVMTVHVGVGESSVPCNLGEEPLEAGLDWDRWLGPAPMRPYHPVLAPRGVHDHYPKWRLYREYSGGMMTDFGAHMYDIAQWALDMDASNPVEVAPPPDEKMMYGASFRYANGILMRHGGHFGVTFIGEKGMLHVDRDSLTVMPDTLAKEPSPEPEVTLPRAKSHIDNFMDCIRSRERCICDVEVGARTVTCCHLANLAYWHRRALTWDPQKWEFPGDATANAWRDYERRKGYELARA